MKWKIIGLITVIALILLVVRQARQALASGLQAVNPVNPDNIFYSGTNAVLGKLTGDDSFSLGAKIYEWTH